MAVRRRSPMKKTTRTSALAALALSVLAVGGALGYQALEPTPAPGGQFAAEARVSDSALSPRLERSTERGDEVPVDAEDEAEPATEEPPAEPAEPAEPAPAAEPAPPAPAPAPEPEPTPPATAAATQTRLHELLNAQRSAAGVATLARHPALDAAAQEWACEMVTVGMQHSSSGWRDARLSAGWLMNGENVAMGYPTPERATDGWMQSEGHRNNILRTSYTHVGTGWCVDPQSSNGHYWVQLFAQL